MINLDGQLETNDMIFAVVLCLNGFHPEMERNGSGVTWTLALDGEDDIEDFVSQYNRGQILVEPRRFSREWTAMRQDVYRLMNVVDKPQGERVRPSRNHA